MENATDPGPSATNAAASSAASRDSRRRASAYVPSRPSSAATFATSTPPSGRSPPSGAATAAVRAGYSGKNTVSGYGPLTGPAW